MEIPQDEYWIGCLFHDRADPTIVAVIDGEHYVIAPEDENRSFWSARGFGGRKFVIRFFDGREVTTTNLWHQGTIPPKFRDQMPDNAEFVTNG